MRVIFMGTPDFSVPALEALVDAGHEVTAVYSQPPRPAGRGKKERASPVQRRAEALGLPVCTPASLRQPEAQATFAAFGADVAVVVAYGLILPQVILDSPRFGCVNIHASLLPRWRGAAPIHRAIMAGDKQSGVCIMQMEAGLDTGPVLLCEAVDIGAETTTGDLHDELSHLGARMIVEVLRDMKEIQAVPQSEEGVTYAHKIEKSEARIDWRDSATQVARHINGLSPVPGAWCMAGSDRVKILRAREASGTGDPGDVLGGFTVACGEGAIEVTRAQRAGKPAMSRDNFLRGAQLPLRLE